MASKLVEKDMFVCLFVFIKQIGDTIQIQTKDMVFSKNSDDY